MIDRYTDERIGAMFEDRTRLERYLEIELLATEAQALVGVVPAAAAAACRSRRPAVDAEFLRAVAEREAVTNHDVAAFVDVVQGRIGMPEGAWIHHGLTSSDVVDTAWCWMLRDAASLILDELDVLVQETVTLARSHSTTVMVGRTHGMHAEPTTFGAKVALWALQLDRERTRLRAARAAIAVCKLSGAVGTYSNVDPRVEAHVATSLGLSPVPATQVVARDRHAEYLWACASLGTTVESIAVELRHLQRTEVAEVREGFRSGQKGSSAMPHKRNPISSETLTGLSRVLRANLQVGLQDVALWHERDISHSSAERIVLPDSSILAFEVVKRLRTLLAGLEVDAERMRINLESSHGVVYSQAVLLALVESGLSRDEAYRLVQDAAARATRERRHLRDVLAEMDRLPDGVLAGCFDPAYAVRNASRAIDALGSIE